MVGKLVDELREKSKHDAVIIVGSEIWEALCELEVELINYKLGFATQSERVAELEERLTVEQPCNYCHQYHGKDVCEELLAENKRLREENARIVPESQQAHRCNDELVHERSQLKAEIKRLRDVEITVLKHCADLLRCAAILDGPPGFVNTSKEIQKAAMELAKALEDKS